MAALLFNPDGSKRPEWGTIYGVHDPDYYIITGSYDVALTTLWAYDKYAHVFVDEDSVNVLYKSSKGINLVKNRGVGYYEDPDTNFTTKSIMVINDSGAYSFSRAGVYKIDFSFTLGFVGSNSVTAECVYWSSPTAGGVMNSTRLSPTSIDIQTKGYINYTAYVDAEAGSAVLIFLAGGLSQTLGSIDSLNIKISQIG